MPERETNTVKIPLALLAVGAVVAALVLIFFAGFPYVFAESGSARYARDHRGEAILQLLGAAVLLVFAWWGIRNSLSSRTWLQIAAMIVGLISFQGINGYTRRPANVRHIGGKWYVAGQQEPDYPDPIIYRLYYKNGLHYQSIGEQAGEYRFVAPDCVIYRGLRVSGRPAYAVCGSRRPFETRDTSMTEAVLLSEAHRQPR